MNKLLRIIAGITIIILGLLVGLFTISVWPHPFNWGSVFLLIPLVIFSIGFIAIGGAVLAGISRKEAFELMMDLWH
jgi:hypothetical protein